LESLGFNLHMTQPSSTRKFLRRKLIVDILVGFFLFLISSCRPSLSIDITMSKVLAKNKNALEHVRALTAQEPELHFVRQGSVHFETRRLERSEWKANLNVKALHLIESLLANMNVVGARRLWSEGGKVQLSYSSLISENCDHGLVYFPETVIGEVVFSIGNLDNLYEARRASGKSWKIVRKLEGKWYAYASCSYQ